MSILQSPGKKYYACSYFQAHKAAQTIGIIEYTTEAELTKLLPQYAADVELDPAKSIPVSVGSQEPRFSLINVDEQINVLISTLQFVDSERERSSRTAQLNKLNAAKEQALLSIRMKLIRIVFFQGIHPHLSLI